MSLTEQQNQAVTQILIEFYNNLLVDIMQKLYNKQCSDLGVSRSISDQVNILQLGMIDTLKQSANQSFQQTKASLFNFISSRQSARLTEQSFKNIFDKYFLPQTLLQEYKQRPNDVVLQMGMTLIVGNIKGIFQDTNKCKQLIKLMNKESLKPNYFIEYLTPIIEKIRQSMHSQLIGEPIKPIIKDVQKSCTKCKKLQQKINLLEQSNALMEEQNKLLKQMIEELHTNTVTKQQEKQQIDKSVKLKPTGSQKAFKIESDEDDEESQNSSNSESIEFGEEEEDEDDEEEAQSIQNFDEGTNSIKKIDMSRQNQLTEDVSLII